MRRIIVNTIFLSIIIHSLVVSLCAHGMAYVYYMVNCVYVLRDRLFEHYYIRSWEDNFVWFPHFSDGKKKELLLLLCITILGQRVCVYECGWLAGWLRSLYAVYYYY